MMRMTQMKPVLKRRQIEGALLPLVLLAILAMAACGMPTANTSTQPPAMTAASVLRNATAARIKDATFAMTVKTSTLGASVSATGNGALTKTPQRLRMDVSTNLAGTPLTLSLLTDSATNATFLRFDNTNPLGIPSGTWYNASTGTLSSLGGLSADISTFLNYGTLQHATLSASPPINGVAVWHIHANDTLAGMPTVGTSANENATVDYYFRQNNFYPVQAVIKASGTATLNMTVTFTGINTNTSITLPAASDVQTLP